MGYYTAYNLDWKPKLGEVTVFIAKKQKEDDSFAYGVNEFGDMTDSVKWYDHEKDIRLLSKEFPDILFTLSGEGEESGDVWKKYFKNGKMQVSRAEIKIEEFNPHKLR